MSDDFMEEEFERDRNMTFRLVELVELKRPWNVVRAQFPDLSRVELIVSGDEHAGGRLWRRLEVYGDGDKWQISFRPKWIDEVLPDDEAQMEMKRQGVSEIKRILYSHDG